MTDNRGVLGGAYLDSVDWALPAPASAHGNGTNNITSTSFAVLPTTTVSQAMTNPHPRAKLLVVVEYGAWLVGAASTDVRASLVVTGSLSASAGIGGGGAVGWGEVLFATATASAQHSSMVTFELPVSATAATFQVYAMKNGAGTPQCNYPTVSIVPVRFLFD